MKSEQMSRRRSELNRLMTSNDDFFVEFGALDDQAYAAGAIDKKHKELMGLAISVVTRCDECILYHIGGCLEANATRDEIIEAIKIGVIGGGSITYPNARFAFEMLKELKVIE